MMCQADVQSLLEGLTFFTLHGRSGAAEWLGSATEALLKQKLYITLSASIYTEDLLKVRENIGKSPFHGLFHTCSGQECSGQHIWLVCSQLFSPVFTGICLDGLWRGVRRHLRHSSGPSEQAWWCLTRASSRTKADRHGF